MSVNSCYEFIYLNNNNNNNIIIIIALAKKDGGVRPIAVGYGLRRLAAKCANTHVIGDRSKVLQPRQVGVGVAGGAEAAIPATRRYVNQIPSGHAFIKLVQYLTTGCST